MYLRRQNIAQFRIRTMRVDNLALANLRFYPLRCAVDSWDASVRCLPKDKTTHYAGAGIEITTLQLLMNEKNYIGYFGMD